MHIILNGEAHSLQKSQNLIELLEDLKLTGRRLAVEVNAEIIPKSQYSSRQLQAGDRVEIVHAIGGG